MARPTSLWFFGILALGCSAADRAPEAGDAAPAPLERQPEAAAAPLVVAPAVIERVRAFGPWAWSLDAGARIEERASGFQLAASSADRDPTISRKVGAWTTIGSPLLSTVVARHADGVAHIARQDDPDFYVDLVDLDVKPVTGAVEGNAIVYGDASPSVDVVQIVNPARVEEVRVLRDASAHAGLRFRVRKGPAVRDVVRVDDRIEVRGANGLAGIMSEPIFAIDALGERRALDVQADVEGDELVVSAKLDTAGLQHPIAIDPAWTAAASMTTAVREAAVVAIPRVSTIGSTQDSIYVIGGTASSGAMVTAVERLNFGVTPATWTAVGVPQLPVGRQRDKAIRLPYSTTFPAEAIFLTGGVASVAEGSRWSRPQDIDANRPWVAASDVGKGRYAGTATYLGGTNQVVMVTGGWNNGLNDAVATAERWQRSAPTSILATASMGTKRAYHGAEVLSDGRLLVMGGSMRPTPTTVAYSSTAERYTPSSNSWASAAAMNYPRHWFTTVKLSDGRVLVAGGGGYSGGAVNTAEVFNPATGTTGAWTATANTMSTYRGNFSGVLLSNGRVLVAGGQWSSTFHSTAEVYDPATNQWQSAGAMSVRRAEFSLVRPIIGGTTQAYAYAIGGTAGGGSVTNVVDRFDQQPLGASCAGGGECQSGNCVNSVCCSTATCSAGYACNLPTKLGTCSKLNGQVCSIGAECGSGNCSVDGVCCNAACNGQCESCKETGSVGTCIAVSGAPRAPRTACSGTGACQATCTGLDTNRTACGAMPTGNKCADAACTTSGSVSTQTPARFCDGSGVCPAVTSTTCGAYQCSGTVCKGSCTVATQAADCATGYHCEGSVCVTNGTAGTACTSGTQCSSGFCVDNVCCTVSSCTAPNKCNATTDGTCKKPAGIACGGDAECGSGFCTDGVCCNARCDGQCEACNVTAGSCLPVVGAPKGTRAACAGTGTCAKTCDGANRAACGAFPGTSTVCSPASCTAGTAKPTEYCDGAGSCATLSTISCGAYQCGGAACKGSCTIATSASDCATGYACKDGACLTTGALGTTCTSGVQCTSGNCVPSSGGKSVCCETDACPTGAFCGDSTSGAAAGKCVKAAGDTCTGPSECASGFCIDGVCCDSVCAGQCEACDIPGAVGKCTGVSGAPHGSRTACFDGAGDVCKTLSCDGSKDRSKCVGYANGPEKECKPGSCADGAAVEASRCDGFGTCKDGSAKPCGGFGCDGASCRTTCAADTDCAKGYVCDSTTSKCVPPSKSCSDDGQSSISPDKTVTKPCAPFKCNTSTGDCYDTCTSSDQCGGSALCQGNVCVPPAPPPTEDDGGCTLSSRPRTDRSYAAFAVAGALVAAWLRRRRADRDV